MASPSATGQGFGRRFLARLVDPATLMTLPTAVAFCLLRPLGLIAPLPYWAIVTLLLLASLINSLLVALVPDVSSGWRLTLRTGVYAAVIAAVIYGIGWGPLLAVGFVFGAADAMRVGGSRAAREAIIFTVVWMGIGLVLHGGLLPALSTCQGETGRLPRPGPKVRGTSDQAGRAVHWPMIDRAQPTPLSTRSLVRCPVARLGPVGVLLTAMARCPRRAGSASWPWAKSFPS